MATSGAFQKPPCAWSMSEFGRLADMTRTVSTSQIDPKPTSTHLIIEHALNAGAAACSAVVFQERVRR